MGAPPPGEPGIVLIVDDDEDLRATYRVHLESVGHEVLEAGSVEAARAIIQGDENHPETLVLDLTLPKESGLDLIQWMQQHQVRIPTVMVTASREVEHAVFALKNGARDYLTKPIGREKLLLSVQNALAHGQMERELVARRVLDQVPEAQNREGAFISLEMRLVLSTLEKVKDSQVPVLIQGESGTGKEVVARELHRLGQRRSGPFVAVNCAALPRELVESELFGHEKGAFTGADQTHPGRFEEARGGTLFLDEIGELDPAVQAKLLRAIETKSVTPVGGSSVEVDTRVVAATNRDLATEVAEGRFREDLYYRLEVITVLLPPLRERTGAIGPLAHHLLKKVTAEEGLAPRVLTPGAIEILEQHAWPGNVRELLNVLKRAVLLGQGPQILPEHVVLSPRRSLKPDPATNPNPRSSSPDDERERMLRALAETRGNVSAAARLLGIGRSTFYRRAKQFTIPL